MSGFTSLEKNKIKFSRSLCAVFCINHFNWTEEIANFWQKFCLLKFLASYTKAHMKNVVTLTVCTENIILYQNLTMDFCAYLYAKYSMLWLSTNSILFNRPPNRTACKWMSVTVTRTVISSAIYNCDYK